MKYLCLDFEGVLIPEIWQQVAEATNSKDLMLTTQDLKDYDELMQLRMNVVNEKGIKLSDCLLYTSPSPRDDISSRMPSSA